MVSGSLRLVRGGLDLLFFSYAQSLLVVLIHAVSLMLDFSCLLFFTEVERQPLLFFILPVDFQNLFLENFQTLLMQTIKLRNKVTASKSPSEKMKNLVLLFFFSPLI